jgi:hypothetical protein
MPADQTNWIMSVGTFNTNEQALIQKSFPYFNEREQLDLIDIFHQPLVITSATVSKDNLFSSQASSVNY